VTYRRATRTWLFAFLILCLPVAEAGDLYFVDAHSQFDTNVYAALIIKRMDEGGVYKTILASRGDRKPGEAADLAEQYPGRIVASIRTKGRQYINGSKIYYQKLKKRVRSGRFSAIAELLVFHAQKGNKAERVQVAVNDKRVLKTLEYAKERGWPLVLHIEFASLPGDERDEYMAGLNRLLNDNPDYPFALAHMGQLPPEQVGALIKAHNNIYFLTSHADPVSDANSKQPWTNMIEHDKFKAPWKTLITQHPDRFVFAIDNVWDWQWKITYLKHIKLWRSALAELPETVANAVAHGNAERLWHLEPKP
jgi:predicted TIM-barrel fold metal-dependent hydrolase